MKRKTPRRVTYELIQDENGEDKPGIYTLLRDLIVLHHHWLIDARIALAWNTSWKPDVDGRCALGKCKKASDLDRELMQYDFVILLRREFWFAPEVTDAQRAALLDHELCHADVKLDDDSEPVVDERGRPVYRLRKHDLEEFAEVAERHGCWKRDLEHFAQALRRSEATPLLNQDDPVIPASKKLTRELKRLGASVRGQAVTTAADPLTH